MSNRQIPPLVNNNILDLLPLQQCFTVNKFIDKALFVFNREPFVMFSYQLTLLFCRRHNKLFLFVSYVMTFLHCYALVYTEVLDVNPLINSKEQKILLLYARDCAPFMDVMLTFRELLQKYCKCEVSFCSNTWLQQKNKIFMLITLHETTNKADLSNNYF
jgi:hypothetical protein